MPRGLIVPAVGLALAGLAFALARAQSTAIPVPDAAPVQVASLDVSLAGTRPGDPAAGEAKAATCLACHGPDGNSPIDMYPRLAGQSERYVAEQLALIANGRRHGGMTAVMLPFVQDLSAQDMRDIGAWYAGRHGEAGVAEDTAIAEGPYAGMKLHQVGERLYRGGDAARGLPACLACHGPAGAGNPGPPWPRIGGQHAAYAARRLEEYRAGADGPGAADTPAFATMHQVARTLTDQEIQGLSAYLQGLHDRHEDLARAPAAP